VGVNSSNNGIRISVPMQLTGASGATSTIRVIYGGTTIASSSAVAGNNVGGYGQALIDIFARGSTASQKATGQFFFATSLGGSTIAADIQQGTAAVDASAVQTLSFTVQIAGAFNAGRALGYTVTKLQF
jgi:hypothetical protein